MKIQGLFALSSLLVLAACGGGMDNLPPPPAAPPAAPEAVATDDTTPKEPAPEEAKLPAPQVVLGEAAADPAAPTPTVKITAPKAEQLLKADAAGDFAVKLDVKNWATAEGDAHVHLILDNKPYKAIYDTKAPIKLSELTGGEPLAEGEHVLVAFPSRKTHESVKTKGALTAIRFWVGKKDAKAADPTKGPLLVYSRPKGDYAGAMAQHILIDFQLHNVELGEGKHQVRFIVSGPGIPGNATVQASEFGKPFYLDDAQAGTYTLRAELLDKDSQVVAGAWNSTTRSITVDPKAAASDPHAGHGAPAAEKK